MHIYESVTQPTLYLKLRLMKDIPHTLKTTVCVHFRVILQLITTARVAKCSKYYLNTTILIT